MKRLFLSALVTIVVTGNLLAQTASITSTNVLCNGDCTGSATVIVQPPGNYHFIWNTGDTTSSIANLCAGNYLCAITDSAGNFIDSLATSISQPPQLLINTSIINVSCFGGNDAYVSVTATGGVAPYTYLWNGVIFGQNLTNVSAGTYILLVTDANGCTANDTVTIGEPIALTVTGTVTNGSCSNPGMICLNVSGGTAPYLYHWSNGVSFPNNCITGLTSANYSVTVTDANACTAAQSFNVTGNYWSNIISESCLGCDGSITISGATGATFLWSNTATTASIQNLCAGNYYLTITDTAGVCIDTFTVLPAVPLTITINSSGSNCSGSSGYACAVVTGATFPISYLWSNGQTASCLQGVPPGTYSVTVTDNRSCSATKSVTISSLLNVTTTGVNPTCGNADGTISVSVSGGSGIYSYQWFPISGTDSFITGLPPGSYIVVVQDTVTNCTKTDTIYLYGTCGSVSGHVFEDLNGNGVEDVGESGLAGITVSLNPGGLNTVTNLNGDYSIGVGTFDTFSLQVNAPGRYYCSATLLLSDSVTFPPGNLHSVILTPGSPNATGIDFGLAHPQPPCGIISGFVFNDANGNGIKDPIETGKSGINIRLSTGQQTQTDFNGNYSVEVGLNIPVIISLIPAPQSYFCGANQPYYVQTFPVSPPDYTVTLTSGSPNSTGNNFGVNQTFAAFDVGIYSIRSFSGVHAGQTFTAWMDFKASGSITNTCCLRLNFNPLVSFVSAYFPPTTVTGTYVEWCFLPGSAPSAFCMMMTFALDSSATAGTQLVWTGTYSCGNPDQCPGNNELTVINTVQTGPLRRIQDNGFNFMEIQHTGDPAGFITHADSVFSYLINFQNTGSDTAYHLTIVDTLPPHLNVETMSQPFSSNAYQLCVPEPNILVWEFDNIRLPDTSTNFLRSYGFIQYNIHMKPNLPYGTVIDNHATISFNYGEPYLTNNTSVEILLPVGTNGNFEENQINIYPNPAQDMIFVESKEEILSVKIFDAYGREVKSEFVNGTNKSFMTSGLAKGVYLINVELNGFIENEKIIIY